MYIYNKIFGILGVDRSLVKGGMTPNTSIVTTNDILDSVSSHFIGLSYVYV